MGGGVEGAGTVVVRNTLADLLAAAHLGVIGFVIVGAPLCWRWPRLLRVHAPVAAGVLAVNLAHLNCPLTDWEHALRSDGPSAYTDGFVAHYLVEPLLGHGVTPAVRLGLYLVTVTPIAVSYAAIAGRSARRRSGRSGSAAAAG